MTAPSTPGDAKKQPIAERLRFLLEERRHVQIGVVEDDLIEAIVALESVRSERVAFTHFYCADCDEFVRGPCSLKDCTVASAPSAARETAGLADGIEYVLGLSSNLLPSERAKLQNAAEIIRRRAPNATPQTLPSAARESGASCDPIGQSSCDPIRHDDKKQSVTHRWSGPYHDRLEYLVDDRALTMEEVKGYLNHALSAPSSAAAPSDEYRVLFASYEARKQQLAGAEARIAELEAALSATKENFIFIGRLHRTSGRLTGQPTVSFSLETDSIPLGVHEMMRVYRKEGEDSE